MARTEFDGEISGQMSIDDLYRPPERLFAVSRIFARARKNMNLAEQKTFVYALSHLKFTEPTKINIIYLDKKTLARVIGINSDTDHLSVNLQRAIGDLPEHSYIKISKEDKDLFDSGTIITRLTMFKNLVRIKFEREYLALFTGLSTDYITMWSSDIFQMQSKRSVQFYERLRQETDTRQSVNSYGFGIKALKEMFNIPMDGDGSYMRKDGHFDRPAFEKYVIQALCDDLKHCKMINLVIQPDGKPYEKVKRGNRVLGYRFYWTFTSHPAVATAEEVHEMQERVDKNPVVLKIAKNMMNGQKKPKKNNFIPDNNGANNDLMEQIQYDNLD